MRRPDRARPTPPPTALPVAITRCGNFYGGGDLNWNRIVPGTIRSLLRGERPVIRSDGTFVRDYFYVEDGAAAYIAPGRAARRATRSLPGEAFNFSNEQPRHRARAASSGSSRLMGVDLEPACSNEATQRDPGTSTSTAAKARDACSAGRPRSLDEGLRRTVDWYRTLPATDRCMSCAP